MFSLSTVMVFWSALVLTISLALFIFSSARISNKVVISSFSSLGDLIFPFPNSLHCYAKTSTWIAVLLSSP